MFNDMVVIIIISRLIYEGKKYYNHNSWTRDDLLKYSENKFREVVKYAISNSQFYKEYYQSCNINLNKIDNISPNEFPIIDKQLIRDNFYKIVTRPICKKAIEKALSSKNMLPRVGSRYVVHTSGSTGTPTNFIYDKKSMDILESNFIRLSTIGENSIGLKDFPIRSLYIAPVGNGYACTALAIYGMSNYKSKNVIINAQTPLSEWKDIINRFNPNYLSGYPSCISLVAELQQMGSINITPKKIIIGGEPLQNNIKSNLEKTFKADIIDYYGCTESILLGAGSSQFDGIYLFDDLNYLEVDSNNRLIITSLYNKSFPLIRYRLGDVIRGFKKEQFGCLPFTHIDKVVGREEELMWFINQKGEQDFLHPLFLDDLDVNGIKKYQFEQISNTYFKIRCISTEKELTAQKNEIRNQINYFLEVKDLCNVKFDIELVNTIPNDELTGKAKLIIRDSYKASFKGH